MFLFIAATELEMRPFSGQPLPDGIDTLVTGVGCIETAMRLARRLADPDGEACQGVVQFGVGGAYVDVPGAAGLLDLCAATREEWADFGVRLGAGVLPFEVDLPAVTAFDLEGDFYRTCLAYLDASGIDVRPGPFATVSAVTGTREGGRALAARSQSLCENMEGAAAARVCQVEGVPFFELRAISNLVVDRSRADWRLAEAASTAARAARNLAERLGGEAA